MLLLGVVGGVAGFLLIPPRSERVLSRETPTPQVTLDGKSLPLDGTEEETLEQARALARAYVGERLKLSVPAAGRGKTEDGEPVPIAFERTREEFGATVDGERLKNLVRQARDARSALRRGHYRSGAKTLALPMPVSAAQDRAMATLLTAKDELDRPPVDAKYNLQTHAIAEDQPGARMDVYATLSRLDAAFAKGEREVEAVVETVPAKRTKQALGAVVVDDVLGYFETKYANDWAHQARAYNLRLAASKLDGHVMMPGEIFDFNEVVGPRSEAYGYKVASVIAQGEVVDGIGGGTCQVSGTLHGAALFAGLDIVERRPHTRPSFYIKMGMDATVVYPTITMRLRNPFPFPVVLHETVEGGVARAEILGPKRNRDVTYVRKIDDVVPFQEKEIPDPAIPKEERQLQQRGIPGFKITRYRVVRTGPFAVRERMPDYYPPTTQIWRVGTGPKDPKFKPKDDSHPEYVADQFLTISQGPSIRGSQKGGGTVESRIGGKYGSYGWTFREGLTKYRDRAEKPSEDKPGTD
jgi:vancomycin resistance protein YoaR